MPRITIAVARMVHTTMATIQEMGSEIREVRPTVTATPLHSIGTTTTTRSTKTDHAPINHRTTIKAELAVAVTAAVQM